MTPTRRATAKRTTVRSFLRRFRGARPTLASRARAAPAGPSGLIHAAAAGVGAPTPPGTAFAVDVDGHRVVGQTWGKGRRVPAARRAGRPARSARSWRLVARGTGSSRSTRPATRLGPARRAAVSVHWIRVRSDRVVAPRAGRAIVSHSVGACRRRVALCDGRARPLVLLAPTASPAGLSARSPLLGSARACRR